MGRIGLNAFRIGAAPAALVLAAVLTLALLHVRSDGVLPTIRGIGGPFALVDHHGKAVTERNYLGKPTLVFFGFTFCPDVCPTTPVDLSNQLSELGPDADRLNVVFISARSGTRYAAAARSFSPR